MVFEGGVYVASPAGLWAGKLESQSERQSFAHLTKTKANLPSDNVSSVVALPHWIVVGTERGIAFYPHEYFRATFAFRFAPIQIDGLAQPRAACQSHPPFHSAALGQSAVSRAGMPFKADVF